MPFLVGVLSDTHGLLRPEVLPALSGVDHILHAGDIGSQQILDDLRSIAPVTAIRGNTDTHGPCALLPATEMVELAEHFFYLVHDIAQLDINPSAAGVDCIIFGHSHKPSFEERQGVFYLNPGSCGPRRFSLPITLALLEIDGERIMHRLIHLI
ncbi:metallophosphoesterase family protein [Terriglobus albidus]|uniref:metallophosphoesterase family protein n=1 Tax=Terriglobus albidus TaxID=1592106 RepID=UPI0021DF5840|nr:metallophosphoesterase family protein [Terriglobus albidus]